MRMQAVKQAFENESLVIALEAMGKSIARWTAEGDQLVTAIPGTTKLDHLKENLGAVTVVLTSDDLRQIESAYAKIRVQGARASEEVMKLHDVMI